MGKYDEHRLLHRAKRLDNGEWVEGFPVKLGFDYWIYTGEVNNSDPIKYMVDPETLCPYTGLPDKNGKKIWMNDIVKKEFYTDYEAFANSEEYIGVVKIQDCAWVIETRRRCCRPIFEAMAYSEDVKHFEVVGNAFDNRELLEENDIRSELSDQEETEVEIC